jgi:phospholipid-translocating ATPase
LFQVGDIVIVEKGRRVPADMILLRTTEDDGSCFLRTDQLDGETDWKKRDSIRETQGLSDDAILSLDNAYCLVPLPEKVCKHKKVK